MGSYQLEDPLQSQFVSNKLIDPEEFRKQAHLVVDFLADYYRDVAKYPVLSQVEPGYLRKCLPGSAPDNPESIDTILKDVVKDIIPGITHWQSPNYFAYFPSSGSTAGFIGEMLSIGFNVVGFNWMSSPAATELESIVMDWLGRMLSLPDSFLFSGNDTTGGGGVLQGTTCEVILCTLVAARDRALEQVGKHNIGKLVVYGSDQTHCALKKACQIAGIVNFRAVATSRATNFGLSPESVRHAMAEDTKSGLVPLFLCATVGTTSSTAVDPVKPLTQVAKEFGVWVHVDAAYAGSACVCPEFRHFIDGVEDVDSFSMNAHKWFFTNLDCCCLWVRNHGALVESLSTNPEYLWNKATESKKVIDYKDWQIALSRRFRALKLWLVLRSYGVTKIRNFIRSHVRMAKQFEILVAMDKRFEVVVPRKFAMVCFRLLLPAPVPAGAEEGCAAKLNQQLLEAVNSSGRIYMTHAMVGGTYMIRFAVGASLTEDCHVFQAWKVIQEYASNLLDGWECV
ncbi:tyrosine decarboxylase-like [Nymphaea colorata]|nr:tyrosine decarboxylase-like [Nymphaea colorata]